MKNNKDLLFFLLAMVVLAVVILMIFVNLNKTSKENVRDGYYEGEMPLERISQYSGCPLTENKDDFAKCLTEKGWVMYGSVSCTHCQAQKKLFGDSFQFIKYVECSENTQFCLEKGIRGYPTWIVEKEL